MNHRTMLRPWAFAAAVLLCVVPTSAAQFEKKFDCDPCLERSEYRVKVITHGPSSEEFWQQVQKTGRQAGKDMRVELDFDLYDNFLEEKMAADIRQVGNQARAGDPNTPHALVVTIPSPAIAEAVEETAQVVPMFAINSGYDIAQSLGVLGVVAMDEYTGGVAAAEAFLEERMDISSAVFLNHDLGNDSLRQRFNGFADALSKNRTADATTIAELVVDFAEEDPITTIASAMEGCPFEAVLTSSAETLQVAKAALFETGCAAKGTLLGTFDTDTEVYRTIARGDLLFAISQQHALQGTLGVLLASLYSTTGKTLASSSTAESGIYASGPKVVTLRNLPSDTLQICESEAFPVCSGEDEDQTITTAACPCIDRSKIKIGGVLHGETTAEFWDIMFANARQAADDLGVELLMDRFEPQPSPEIWFSKLATKIVSLCHEGVDGLFLSIPSDSVVAAIEQCRALNVPVISVNSGASTAESLGLTHHISQLEYTGGYAAGLRLLESGMKEAICLNFEIENVGQLERCAGFSDAVKTNPDATYLGMLVVPPDLEESAIRTVEEAVGRDDDWEGVGISNGGPQTASVVRALNKIHPKLVAGTFDLSPEINKGIDDGSFQYAIDQNPLVQGYMPVWLLTTIAASRQSLLNRFIETGPVFQENSPSLDLQLCTENFFEACEPPQDRNFNDNLLDQGILVFGYVAVGLTWALSLASLSWLAKNRHAGIVQASQPGFLILICVGAIVSSSTIIALSFQGGSEDDLSLASWGCSLAPFLYSIGWSLIFSSLCAKTFRLYKIMQNCADNRQEVVTFLSVAKIVLLALIVDIGIVVAWTVWNPLVYKRKELSTEINIETQAITINSIGFCAQRDEDGPSTFAFAGTLVGFHLILLVATNILLYKVKNLKDRYQESKFVGFAMIVMFQTLIVGIPIVLAVGDSTAVHVVFTGIIAVHDICVLALLFIPKLMFQASEDDRDHNKEDSVIIASLKKVSTSKFGDALQVLDDLAVPDSSKGLTENQRAQLRLVRTLLIQGNTDRRMFVPTNLYSNPKSNDFILREFGGVRAISREFGGVRAISDVEVDTVSRASFSSTDSTNATMQTLPEFHDLELEDQRKVCRILSWENLKRWDFSVFELTEITGDDSLVFVGWAILGSPFAQYEMASACGLEDPDGDAGYSFRDHSLKIRLRTLCNYLRAVQGAYHGHNPYHNATHAADVLQTLHAMIQMNKEILVVDMEEILSILLAAAVHDVNHPGKNNSFQVNALTKAALTYNDSSVLENMHAAYAFELMLEAGEQDISRGKGRYNFLSNLRPAKFDAIRKKVVSAIMQTDMSKHFAAVAAVKGSLQGAVARGGDEGITLDWKQRWDLLMYLLHAADISGQAKGDPLFKIWADRCFDEFFAQGDTESFMGLPISPNCDRKTTKKADSQVGFIQFVVRPTFEAIVPAVPAVQKHILPQIDSNAAFWQSQSMATFVPPAKAEQAPEAAVTTSSAGSQSSISVLKD